MIFAGQVGRRVSLVTFMSIVMPLSLFGETELLGKGSPHPYLLISSNSGIIQSYIGTNISNYLYSQYDAHPLAIDYFINENQTILFWSDLTLDSIVSGEIVNGTLKNVNTVVTGGLESVEGLAVDWLSCHIYWVESKHREIEVSRCDGSERTSLIGNVEKPRGLALDPVERLLFWTDWEKENPRIESSFLSGTGRRVIVNTLDYNSSLPNGVALDLSSKRLFWLDALVGVIHSVNYDGSGHIEVLRLPSFDKPFSLDVFQGSLYWTDIGFPKLHKANYSSTSIIEEVFIEPKGQRIYQSKVVYPAYRTIKPVKNFCKENNGGCSHVCISEKKQISCLCPYGLELQDDKKTCSAHGPLLFYLTRKSTSYIAFFATENDPSRWIYPPVKLQMEFLAVTFDSRNDILYWIEGRKIKKHYLSNSTTSNLTEFGPKVKLSAISIDSLSGNLYIATIVQLNSVIRNQISVCTVREGYCAHLIWKNVSQVLSLTVDPVNRYLIWAERNILQRDTVLIKRTDLCGDGLTIIRTLKSNNSMIVKGLEANADRKQLCYIEMTTKGVYCMYYEQNRSVELLVAPPSTRSQSTLSFTYAKSKIIYSKRSRGMFAKNIHSSSSGLLWNTSDDILYMQYGKNLEFSGEHPCMDSYKNCSTICLPQIDMDFKCLPLAGSNTLLMFLQQDKPVVYPLIDGLPSSPALLHANFSERAVDSIAFFADKRMVIFASKGKIFHSAVDGHHIDQIMDVFGRVTALEFDKYTDHIYFSVASSNETTVKEANLDGNVVKVLFSTGPNEVTALAVHSQKRWLFWSAMEVRPSIHRLSLVDNSTTIIVKDALLRVSDIVVDTEKDRLFWCDSRTGQVEASYLDGSYRTVVLSRSSHLHISPVSLVLSQSGILWIDRLYSGGSLNKLSWFNRRTTWIVELGPSVSHLRFFEKISLIQGIGDSFSNDTNFNESSGALLLRNPCRGYCFNYATCIIDAQHNPICLCQANFTGSRCSAYTDDPENKYSYVIIIMSGMAFLVLILTAVAIIYVIKSKISFKITCGCTKNEVPSELKVCLNDNSKKQLLSGSTCSMWTNPAYDMCMQDVPKEDHQLLLSDKFASLHS